MTRFFAHAPAMRAMLAVLLHAGSQFWVVSLLARFTTPELLGHYVLGYAVCAPLFMLIGARQRIVLANNVGADDPSWSFIRFRLWACLLTVCAIAVLASALASPNKAVVITLIALLKAAEAVSDICHGSLQRMGRLHTALRSVSQRAVWTTLAVTAVIPWSQSAAAAAATVLVIWVVHAAKDLARVHRINPRTARTPGTATLWDSARHLPTLGLTAMLASLAYYVPRYFISATGTDTDLGYYGAISYFGLIILMMAVAITDYAMPNITRRHRDALRSSAYHTSLRKLYAVLAGMALSTLVMAALAGAPLLRLFFGPAYSAYSMECAVLLAAGGFAALNASQAHAVVALQLIRQQARIASLCFATLVALSAILVPRWGILGAALADLGYAALYFLAVEYCITRNIAKVKV